MRQLRDDAPASARVRWCLAAGIAWAAAAVWPEPDWRAAGLLLGVATVGGVHSDLLVRRDPGVAASLSNTAALLTGAGAILLGRLFMA